jgi:hypothetical protein
MYFYSKYYAFNVKERIDNITLHLYISIGTAIEGVCVTGEAIRPVVPVVSKERVPVASRYGAIFAITTNRKSLI